MKNLKSWFFTAVAACVLMMSPAAALAEGNALSFGFGGGGTADGSGTVGYVEYERALTDSMGLALRAGTLSYDYDDGYYWEEGDGPGMEATFRFYTSEALKGFYIGGGLGVWFTEWDWREAGFSGSGDSTSVELHFALGARIGDTVQFNPSFQLGHFVSSDAELGIYAFVGAAVSMPF